MKARKILLCAVEPSGDALGAALYRYLNQKIPHVSFFGCGGALMAREGFVSLFSTDPFAVMGFSDVARALPEGLKRARELALRAAAEKADAAVLIDGWAFSRLVAKRLKKYSPNTKIYKYAAPQIWASRPQRVDFVKDHFDGVLTLLPFEPPYFEKAGVRAAFVGNPTFQKAWTHRGDGVAFRERFGLKGKNLVLLAPGSRKGEVRRLIKPFEATLNLLAEKISNLHLLIPLAPAVEAYLREQLADWSLPVTYISQADKYDAFAAADVALAASGTVSTELAINGAPTVIAYRVDPLTAIWARRVITTKYISIVNVAANRFVMPEFLQQDCKPENLAQALFRLLSKEEARAAQRQGFDEFLDALKIDGAPAAKSAGDQMIEWAGWDVDGVTNISGF